ncbi:MAG: DUF1501 domain-containing protein, partial [Bryobacterales bacterium]|nr:DUF1501 domain-containing protein [Bryobacterales bacterium]
MDGIHPQQRAFERSGGELLEDEAGGVGVERLQAGVGYRVGEAADAPPHHPARAKRVVHVCLCGGMSHIDSLDHKPMLEKLHGKKLAGGEKPETFFGQIGLLRKNDWPFRPRGKSGLMLSDLFPHIHALADELCVIRSMVADSANHTPATFQQNSGFRLNGFPAMGSWISYGL